jgi:hypothetical protein
MPPRTLVTPRAALWAPAMTSASPTRAWGLRALAAVLVGLAGCAAIGTPAALSLMTVAAVGALLIGARHPTAAALAMTCVVVLDGHAADFLQPALARVTGGLWRYNTIGFAFVVLAVMGARTALSRPDPHTRLALALAAFMALSLAWSPDRLRGAQLVLDVVPFFGMVCLFARIADDPEAWYWMGIVGGTLAAGAGLAYLMTLSQIPHTNPNVSVFVPIAGLVAVCLAFAGGARSPAQQYALAGLAIINGLWAFLSTSRGGLLTAALCLAFIAFQIRSRRRRGVILAGTVVLGVVVTSFFAPLQQTAVQRLSLLFDPTAAARTRTSGRSDLALGSWEIFTQHPFGVGTGGFEPTWATLGSVGGQRQFMRSGQQFAAHAGWMRVLAENGFIGFGMLGVFVASFAVAGIRRGGRTARNLGLLAAGGLGVSLVTTEFHLKGLFFLAAGAAAALHAMPLDLDAAPARVRRRLSLVGHGGKDHTR